MLYVAIVVVVFLVILISKCVIAVPEGNAFVVERLGRYDRTLPPGLHVIPPFTDRVAFRYSLLPREETISDQCVTLDNVPVRVTSVLRAQVRDARQAAYATASAADSIVTLVRTHQRQSIGQRSWDDLRQYPRELESAVVSSAAGPAGEMGITILALDVKNLERVE
jgi:regulator of protease activity HflC (stomatin/prohibitin superfamily)